MRKIARPIRIEFPGAIYHVMARGDGGKMVFGTDDDRNSFLFRLGKVCGSHGGRAAQVGWVADSDRSGFFYGGGVVTPGPILSFGIVPGSAAAPGSRTASVSGGYLIGAGRENGGWSGQFTTPGDGIMSDKYIK